MKSTFIFALASLAAGLANPRPVSAAEPGGAFDAAPFGLPLSDGQGIMWEDPREIHRVVAHFQGPAPKPDQVRLEYWGSWWPERHLPKDHQPGGGDIGWLELGNWYSYNWRAADAAALAESNSIVFTFRPVNEREFPKLKDYPARFRYTLKLRLAGDAPLSPLERLETFTDSTLVERTFRLAWRKFPAEPVRFEVFNGQQLGDPIREEDCLAVRCRVATNSDPNTFDRTLVTAQWGTEAFTFAMDDLGEGPILLPHLGVAVLAAQDARNYTAVARATEERGAKTLYDRVAALPEQTWRAAWDGMPPKKSHIYFPLGLDGGRQRFRLPADGSVEFRSNDHYLRNRPGADTARLDLEKPGVRFGFELPRKPVWRGLAEESLPICETTWEADGVRVSQTALVTPLQGTREDGPAPAGDAFAVFLARFTFTNTTSTPQTARLPILGRVGNQRLDLRAGERGWFLSGDHLRGQLQASSPLSSEEKRLFWSQPLAPGQGQSVVFKLPYVVLTEPAERDALEKLEFDRELAAAAGYWRRRLDQSARLVTPEPMLNEFYRSHGMHLLVNCEREPGSDRRFARVGSFGYGAYGNESCMMVVDLERRGYHQEAQNCLDAWLHYQGTVGLPGSFAGHQGVLYGAGGYEAGGYNQHHGWILWMLGEHFRFTRDKPWLSRAAPGMVAGADWIIRETARTTDRHELERGLLPAGRLEDIGDWWTWLSTSCYTWRGLDTAAWALEQIQHPDAARIRQAAGDYHAALLKNFRAAAARAPVVRLRDGTAVPHIPSHVHRRGRSFGWICETLEGALHLIITRAIDPHSPEAAWIVKDYEDNLFLSNQYGYTIPNFERDWFSQGGMSMQACLLLDVEPYLYRDDVKHALRALFNAQAVSYFPDVRLNTEHALPEMGDWRGDHFKSSDESNCAGWLRYLFVREEGEELLLGQAVPREWLRPGQRCGLQNTSTHFGPASLLYNAAQDQITAHIDAPRRNPPQSIRLRFRHPDQRPLSSVTVNDQPWPQFQGEWVRLPGDVAKLTVIARF